jgi:Protein of unknown function (DUF4199)
MNTWLRYGLIAGTALFVPLFGPYIVVGPRPEWMKLGEVIGYTAMFLCMTATFFAMRQEQNRRGPLRFGTALGIGAGVSLVAGLLFGLATWLFYVVAGDELPSQLIVYYSQQVRESGASAEVIARQLQEIEAMRPFFFNRPLQGAVMAATVFLIGMLETLLGAAFFAWRPHRAAAP